MSKPRVTERKLRQRRKVKLASLRALFRKAKNLDERTRIVEKAIKVSPSLNKKVIQESWK